MLEEKIRPFFQKFFVDKIALFLSKFIKANTITIFAIIFGIISGFFIAFSFNYLAITFILLSGYCDILDGSIARIKNTSSNFGAVLDILGDRIVEFSIILGLAFKNPEYSILFLIILGSILLCVTSFLVVGIFSQNTSQKSFNYSSGLIERAESFIFFIVMILFTNLIFILGIIYSILVIFTTFYRVYQFKKQSI